MKAMSVVRIGTNQKQTTVMMAESRERMSPEPMPLALPQSVFACANNFSIWFTRGVTSATVAVEGRLPEILISKRHAT